MKAKKFTRETIREIGIQDRGFPAFNVGDTVSVALRIKEGEKERTQLFEGDIIAIRNHGNSSCFTVRKIGANSVPVERVFPYYSPLIESVELIRRGSVRRAKLYYLRKRVGRAARVTEKIITQEQRQAEMASSEKAKSA
jgi:large subunit ribosomal protein L19